MNNALLLLAAAFAAAPAVAQTTPKPVPVPEARIVQSAAQELRSLVMSRGACYPNDEDEGSRHGAPQCTMAFSGDYQKQYWAMVSMPYSRYSRGHGDEGGTMTIKRWTEQGTIMVVLSSSGSVVKDSFTAANGVEGKLSVELFRQTILDAATKARGAK